MKEYFEVLEIIQEKNYRLWELEGYTEEEFYELMDEDITYALELDHKILKQTLLIADDRGVITTANFYIDISKHQQKFEIGMKGDLTLWNSK